MDTFFITLSVFALALAALAVGVIFARKPLAGTCGGLGNLKERMGDEAACEICGGDPAKKPMDCSRPRQLDPLSNGPAAPL